MHTILTRKCKKCKAEGQLIYNRTLGFYARCPICKCHTKLFEEEVDAKKAWNKGKTYPWAVKW